jgi:hypothetical protein
MYSHLRVATYIAELLDNRFKILGFRFGIDPLLGLFPVLGDVFTLLFSMYLLWIGLRMRIPEERITEMIRNIVLDFVMGLIPVVGDFSDFVYKANIKNLEILKKYSFQDFNK